MRLLVDVPIMMDPSTESQEVEERAESRGRVEVREERLSPTKFGPHTATQQEQEQMDMLDCLSSDRQASTQGYRQERCNKKQSKPCEHAYLVGNKLVVIGTAKKLVRGERFQFDSCWTVSHRNEIECTTVRTMPMCSPVFQ
jgi:hypothetical protein